MPEIAKNQSETKAEIEFAQAFDSSNKIGFSRSLDSAEGRNTRIVRTNLHDEILKLRQEQGKNIFVAGVDIPSQLIELGLVDEYRFVVQPIVAGEGRRLLEGVTRSPKPFCADLRRWSAGWLCGTSSLVPFPILPNECFAFVYGVHGRQKLFGRRRLSGAGRGTPV